MMNSKDINLVSTYYFIDNSISAFNEFSNIFNFKLRNNSSRFGLPDKNLCGG